VPTAYLSPSQLQDLTNVSSAAPGSGDNGKALVWNQAASQWQAEQVAYSNLSGAPPLPIPVVNGGTGTQTGSITGTGALAFASGANGDISVSPDGTGKNVLNKNVEINLTNDGPADSGLTVTLPQGTNNNRGIFFTKGSAYFSVVNLANQSNSLISSFTARTPASQANQNAGLMFNSIFENTDPNQSPLFGVMSFSAFSDTSANLINKEIDCFRFYNGFATIPNTLLLSIKSSGNTTIKGTVTIQSTSASTSTTTGALQVAGGIGAQGNLIVGGTRINYANLPTSPTATGVEVGDLWRDGDVVKVKV
jgi:hypothetical protein